MTFRPPFPVVLSFALVLVVTGCSRAPTPEDTTSPKVTGEHIVFPANSPQQAALTLVPVEPQAAATYRLNARLVWNEDATVRIYSPVTGRVQSVAVTLGEPIMKEAALAKIDSPDLGQAQADLHKAEADLRLADHALVRARSLFEHGAIAGKDLEAAEDGYANAQSEQQRAAARLTLYGTSAAGNVDGLFVLHAPLGGVVVEKNVNVGQEVRSDQMLANMPQLSAPLFVVSDPGRLSILLDATEHDLAVLRPGLDFQIRSAALPGRSFPGKVEWISDALDPATRRLTVRGTVDNADRLLKAEMFVTVEFEAAAGPGLAVPANAVIMKGEKHFVFVEDQPGTYARREIVVGGEQNGRIAVLRGLAAGQRVVTDGSVLLEAIQASNGS